MVCFRYIIVNTLRKCDNKENNNNNNIIIIIIIIIIVTLNNIYTDLNN